MQQQQGGSRYGVPPPEMAGAPLSSGAAYSGRQQPRVEYRQPQQPTAPEEASPIRSRPGPLQPAATGLPVSVFEEFGAGAGGVRGSFPDDEALGASEDAERAGGGVGNRWPRQETLALLKIRSEMDTAFRDSPLKGPLWDDVSRKLAELGYARSAKKCKEKFENVHKYYKRTKEGRAGRQDGKSYRFFTQLEAIQGSGGAASAAVSPFPSGQNNTVQTLASAVAAGEAASTPLLQTSTSLHEPPGGIMKVTAPPSGLKIQPVLFQSTGTVPLDVPAGAAAAGISFSSNTSSSSESDTDGDETEEGVAGAGVLQGGGRKRKREGWLIGSRKMKAFFDGLMKRVTERQEMMQQRFFETIEKRDQDRMIREEAWKRQEIARLNREQEMMAQERAVAASRDAAVISFLEKFTDFPTNYSVTAAAVATRPQTLTEAAAPPPSSPPQHQTPPAVELQLHLPAMEFDSNDHERNELALTQLSVSPDPVSAPEAMGGGSLDIFSPSSLSSRWPKPEVLALIKLRSGLETRYLEAGPKGPLWEEISLGMKRLGYSRNPKRCKEKWENINKYFKKVKESNKKRSEDAKTCPYFHELDALYRKKQFGGGTAAPAPALVAAEQQQELSVSKTNPQQHREPLRTLVAPPIPVPTPPDRSNIADGGTHEMITGDKLQRANSTGIPQVFFTGAPNRGGGAVMKKPEDFIRELMEQQNQPRQVLDPVDSDTMNHEYDDEDEDYGDEEDDDDGKLQYEIQFQRQGVGTAAVGVRAGNQTGKVATAASSAGSFLAMVQ
ncbi:Trihelix transcription factor GT-2 [Platanthera guangdongensis]|uniref:Trihelix transcription factor GT-2 n=1 Tax=Platanthera guangdongensis TaxID=2320717 RepID=A0ABR2LPQ9_9ASPA